jgi:hypothetical protein
MTNEELKSACREVKAYLETVQVSSPDREVSINERGVMVMGICEALLDRLEYEDKVEAERDAAKQDTERLQFILDNFSGYNAIDQTACIEYWWLLEEEREHKSKVTRTDIDALIDARKSEPPQQEPTNAD